MSFKLFILWVAFNVAPARITSFILTSFILTSPDKQAVEYAKQADGGWKAVRTDQRANSTHYSTGTDLAIAPAEVKKLSFPASETVGQEKGIAWHTAESLPLGHGTLENPVAIRRI